jgi:methyl-accepting chemotaxis protein
MFKRSVSRLLVTLSLLAVSGLGLSISFVAVRALQEYASADMIRAGVKADRALFDALVKARSEIPIVQTALLAEDDPKVTIDQAERLATGQIEAALAESRPSLSKEMIERVRTGSAAVVAARSALETEMRRPRTNRDLNATKPWRDAVLALVSVLSEAYGAIDNAIRIADPLVGEMIEARQLAWQVRDHYGIQCSLLRPNIYENRVPSPEIVQRWNVGRGEYTSGLVLLGELASRAGFPDDLAQRVRQAQTATDLAQKRLDSLIAGLDGSGRPAMEASAFTSLCNGPFDSILAIAYGALDEAVKVGETRRSEALAALILSTAGLLVTIGLALATLLGIRYRLIKPLGNIMDVVKLLRSRDFKTELVLNYHPDEFGAMARALEELRISALEAERLEAEAAARRQEDSERARNLTTLCGGFDQTAQGALGQIRQATQGLNVIAGDMRRIAEDTNTRAAAVSAAAAETSQGVQTVAAATEQLSAAIAEVSRRVTMSADHAQDAATMAMETNATVEALDQAVAKIENVVGLISEIASQTNLLALNATIEAARAGDAGKGFSVVANEVKHLATLTAKSTEDIRVQVSTIQSTTQEAVGAIRTIVDVVNQISNDAVAIAASVEQQGVATREISSSVQQVSASTQEVTLTINELAASNRITLGSAGQVGIAVAKVVDEQLALDGAVRLFLDGVRRS